MQADKVDFAALIENDRIERQRQEWQGTFLEYLELVKAQPDLADLAHRRVYHMIAGRGVADLDLEADPRAKRVFGDEPVKVYDFFKDEFFGMERTLEKIVRYFHAAAMGGEEARQVLYFMGPVGSGKSSLMERLKRGLEELEPIFVIDGSPNYSNPLCLIPRHLRPAFEEMLGVRIEGDIDPITRHRLMTEFKGEYEKIDEGAPFAPLKDLVDKFVGNGGRILVCSPCIKKRGITEDMLVDGATPAGGAALVEFLADGAPCVAY